MDSLLALRKNWARSTLGSESCLHQVSPTWKAESSIAHDLIEEFTRPGDLILEPFCGSGVIALEALRLGRSVIASDVSDYAAVLTKAKLEAPLSAGRAVETALRFVRIAKARAKMSRYRVRAPAWVRAFFHRRTLRRLNCSVTFCERKKSGSCWPASWGSSTTRGRAFCHSLLVIWFLISDGRSSRRNGFQNFTNTVMSSPVSSRRFSELIADLKGLRLGLDILLGSVMCENSG